MLSFFKKTYKTRSTYTGSINSLADIIKSFSTNPTVVDSFYDNDRHEGFYKGKMYYLTFELHQTDIGIILETTTTCKLPFFIPRTYSRGFNEFINTKKR